MSHCAAAVFYWDPQAEPTEEAEERIEDPHTHHYRKLVSKSKMQIQALEGDKFCYVECGQDCNLFHSMNLKPNGEEILSRRVTVYLFEHEVNKYMF